MISETELHEVVSIVAQLNDRGLETVGCAAWWVSSNSEQIQVHLYDQCLWDSEEDERELVGTCPTCKGTGAVKVPMGDGTLNENQVMGGTACGSCGGSGKSYPYEPLERYLPRAAFEHALEILGMTRPRNDLEVPMAHDREPSSAWLELIAEAQRQINPVAPEGMEVVWSYVPKEVASLIRRGTITGYSIGTTGVKSAVISPEDYESAERVIGVDYAKGEDRQVEPCPKCGLDIGDNGDEIDGVAVCRLCAAQNKANETGNPVHKDCLGTVKIKALGPKCTSCRNIVSRLSVAWPDEKYSKLVDARKRGV